MIQIVDDNGIVRWLGNNAPPEGHKCKSFPIYGDRADTPMYPRSQWPDLIAKMGGDWKTYPWLSEPHDQNGVGQCCADATTSMGESMRLKQGLPLVMLSAADLYDRINGGVDRGSLLEDALDEAMKNGLGTVETCGTIWRRGQKKAPPEERKRFRFLEVFIAPTFDHFFNGLIAGFDGNTGIMWGENYSPDGDGWLPETPRGGGGHSLHAYMPVMRQGRGGMQYGTADKNSWTKDWGLNGRCVIPENAYRGPVGGWFLCRQIVDEGNVIPIPKE
jgi:hypothetical protein